MSSILTIDEPTGPPLSNAGVLGGLVDSLELGGANRTSNDLTDGLTDGLTGAIAADSTDLAADDVSLDASTTQPILLESGFLGNRVFADTNGNGIQDDGDVGVNGVRVTLTGAGRDGKFGTADDLRESSLTVNGGYFGFDGLVGDRYTLSFSNLPGGYRFSPQGKGTDGERNSDVNPQTGSTAVITLPSGQYNKGWDAGLVPSGPNTATASTTASTTTSRTASSGPKFNYGEALQKSFLFYEAQRSGALPGDNRITWRGNSALDDGEDVGLDLSGGYFDAGDHTKFGFPMAATMTLLSWGVEEYRDGYGRSGQLDEALDAIRWGTDYLLKAHVTENGKTKEFWSQVGDPVLDQAVLQLPELLSTARPAFKIDPQNPGTDMAAEAAAALAAASVIFRPTDKAYADRLLSNAIQLYAFADTYRRGYSALLSEETNAYVTRSGFEDELSWGAIWIHKGLKAQGSSSTAYLNKAESSYASLNFGWTQDWDNKSQGAAVLLAQETGKERYRNDIEDWLGNWLPGGSVPKTSGGLAWLTEWGSLRLSANTAFVAGVYADTVADPGGKYSAFAERQINYILGDNPRNSSYVVGFGNNAPQRVHHQAASGYTDKALWESDRPNQNIIYGALVGGPAKVDDFSYADVRADFRANEVSLEYNAGYTGAVARMYNKYGGQPLSDAALDALPGIRVTGGALASLAEEAEEPDVVLAGVSGPDRFVLGNTTGPLYATQGWGDFAWIENFEVGVDQLVLFGGASDYSIRRDATDTWIFRGTPEGGDAIAGFSNAPSLDLAGLAYV